MNKKLNWHGLTPTFIIPPLAYLAALFHTGCSGGASTVMGVFTAVLNMLFLSFMGERLALNAINLRSEKCESYGIYYHTNECYYDRLILAGGVLCLFFFSGDVFSLSGRFIVIIRLLIPAVKGPTKLMGQFKIIPVITQIPNHSLDISN